MKKITLKMVYELIRKMKYEDREKLYYMLKGADMYKTKPNH